MHPLPILLPNRSWCFVGPTCCTEPAPLLMLLSLLAALAFFTAQLATAVRQPASPLLQAFGPEQTDSHRLCRPQTDATDAAERKASADFHHAAVQHRLHIQRERAAAADNDGGGGGSGGGEQVLAAVFLLLSVVIGMFGLWALVTGKRGGGVRAAAAGVHRMEELIGCTDVELAAAAADEEEAARVATEHAVTAEAEADLRGAFMACDADESGEIGVGRTAAPHSRHCTWPLHDELHRAHSCTTVAGRGAARDPGRDRRHHH